MPLWRVQRGTACACSQQRSTTHRFSEVHVYLFALLSNECLALGDNIELASLFAAHLDLKAFLVPSCLIDLLLQVDDQSLDDLHKLVLALDLHT